MNVASSKPTTEPNSVLVTKIAPPFSTARFWSKIQSDITTSEQESIDTAAPATARFLAKFTRKSCTAVVISLKNRAPLKFSKEQSRIISAETSETAYMPARSVTTLSCFRNVMPAIKVGTSCSVRLTHGDAAHIAIV